MSPLDDLPPDLRAALSLLVDRGKSYAEVADLLGIPQSVVRDRAHAALDALAGTPAEAGAARVRARTPVAAGVGARSSPPASESPSEAPAQDSAGARQPSLSRTPPALPVSRRGGAVLLAGIVLIVAVAVILLTSLGGSSSHKGQAAASARAGTSTPGKTPKITKQLTLTAQDPASKAIGIVEVLAEGEQHAFFIAAEHLPPSKGFFYAIWLYDSPTKAEALSKSPTVASNGRLQGGALLPANAGEYHQILLTRETREPPAHPGPVVLSGAFSLGH